MTYLIRPDTLGSPEATDAAADLHILVCGVHLAQTRSYVRNHGAQYLTAEDHAGASHTKVLTRLQCQFAQLLCGTQTCLTQVMWLAAVKRAQKKLQLFP